MVKNIIVDGDGTIYIDTSQGSLEDTERAILPFSNCVMKQPEQSPIVEYRLDYGKIGISLEKGRSLDEVIKIFEERSAEPLPLSVFSDLKMMVEGELVLAQQGGSFVLSGNHAVIDGIARKGTKSFKLKRLGSRKLRVEARNISRLKKILKERSVKGVQLSGLSTDEDLLFNHGVPFNYVMNKPDLSITRSGGINIINSPNLEKIIEDARNMVRQDVERVKQKIPDYILDIINERLDSKNECLTFEKSKVEQAFNVLDLVLNIDLAKEISQKGFDYIPLLRDNLDLSYGRLMELLKLQGWIFEYGSSKIGGWDMRVNMDLYPERVFYVGKDRFRKAYAFLKKAPNIPDISDLRNELKTKLVKHKNILEAQERIASIAYFCDKRTFYEIADILKLRNYDNKNILSLIVSSVKKINEQAKLEDVVVQIPQIKEKPQIVAIKQIPAFIIEDKKTYQRTDLFQREWKLSLAELRQSVKNLDVMYRCGNDYILLSGEVNSYLWEHTDTLASFVNSCRTLPKRAYNLLKDHFFRCNNLKYRTDDKKYLLLLEEMEESLLIAEILSKKLSPQFTRRRLFEAGMKFTPLYEVYNESGLPSVVITEHFQDLIISLDRERGIIACKSYSNLLSTIRESVIERLAKYSFLIPDEAHVLKALFVEDRAETELTACKHVTTYKMDIDNMIRAGYNLLIAIPDKDHSPETRYVSIIKLSREYGVAKSILTSINGVEIINANRTQYIKLDQELRNKLERFRTDNKDQTSQVYEN